MQCQHPASIPDARFVAGLAASAAIVSGIGPAAAQDYPSGPVQILVALCARRRNRHAGAAACAIAVKHPRTARHRAEPARRRRPGRGHDAAARRRRRSRDPGDKRAGSVHEHGRCDKPPYKGSDFQVIMVDVLDPRDPAGDRRTSTINSFADFVTRAKAQPGKLAVSATQGSAQELFAKWLFGKLGLDVRMVGYNGGGAAANAMLAGDVVAALGDDFRATQHSRPVQGCCSVRRKQEPALAGGCRRCPRPCASTASRCRRRISWRATASMSSRAASRQAIRRDTRSCSRR